MSLGVRNVCVRVTDMSSRNPTALPFGLSFSTGSVIVCSLNLPLNLNRQL